MIFSKDIKNLIVYRRQMYLPTLENSKNSPDKKKGSVIFLLTPNMSSSISLMNNPLLVNKLRYRGYYIEKDLTYYIGAKTLEKDTSLDEAYIFETDNSDLWNDKQRVLFYSGFNKDVEVLQKIFDQDDYYCVIKDLDIKNNIPWLTICVADFPSEDDYYSFKVDYTDPIRLSIHVPRHKESEGYEEYTKRLLNFIYKSVYIATHPDEYGTANPNIIADTLTGADTKYTDQPLGSFKDEVYESATPITMSNLSRKFKYSSTSKFKKQSSTKLNTLKRLLDKLKVNFAPKMNISVNMSPGASNSNTSVNANEGYEYRLYGSEVLSEGIRLGNNRVLFFDESAYDKQLKKILYNDRIRTTKDVMNIYNEVKSQCPFINLTYITLAKYSKNNIFYDLYYYNQTYFENSTYKLKVGFNIYLDLLNKLINDPRVTRAGYKNKTIFIPVLDWTSNPSTKMWLYRENINPVSIIYQLMLTTPQKCVDVFGDMDLFFFDNTNRYFKINFSQFKDNKDIKNAANRFRLFIMKFLSNGVFEPEDEDNENTNPESKEVIKTRIYDAIEASKGVDLTGKDVEANTAETNTKNNKKENTTTKTIEKDKEEIYTKSENKQKRIEKTKELQKLASMIAADADDSVDINDAINKMDSNEELKKILSNIENYKDNAVDMTATRAARINTINDNFLNKEVNGKKVKDLLQDDPKADKIPVSKLKVQSPNKAWENMTYMNFDKNYNVDKDIVACINHFSKGVKYPIAVRDIKVEDTSTSEDRKETYTINIEDFKGDRQTIKLDIPIMKDNRFLLSGNSKVMATQFVNMPILKTDNYAAQIITNYNKIFVYIFKNSIGRTNPIASKLSKTLSKYNGNGIKITNGDNRRTCKKYQLPIDYIDIASVINTIDIKKSKIRIYFNQDQFALDYDNIDYSKGLPYAVHTDTKEIIYYTDMNTFFSQKVVNLLSVDEEFMKIYDKQSATVSGTYSRFSILNKDIPAILILGFSIGLENTLKRAGIRYHFQEKINSEIRNDPTLDYIRFNDGYLVYKTSYLACLLLNGLKDCGVGAVSMADVNKRSTYIEFLDNFGGRSKADGLENFIDCLIDPITKELLEHYKLPTDYAGVLLYAVGLMADNKYVRHTDTSSRRIRRAELIAVNTYKVLSDAYSKWANELRRGRTNADIEINRSAVINAILSLPITQDDSINNALGAVEATNNIAYKGNSGLNNDRSYSLDKRIFDDSMLNVMAGSTNFSANAGISRSSTMNMNVEGIRGYVKQINSDVTKMDTANTLSATEAMIPFEATSDDSARILMSFVQTSKHQVRVEKSDPLLVTSGADEALAYMTTSAFAKKADEDGVVLSIDNDKAIVQYNSGKKDYINLTTVIGKNSDGGYYVPVRHILSSDIKVGSKFKQGDIISYDPESFSNSLGESDNIAYDVGTLAKVAVLNTDEGYEDSGICTHKLSQYLTTQIIYKFEQVIEKQSTIYSIVEKGTYVNVGDPLVVWQDPYDDSDLNSALRVMSTDDASTLGRRTIISETTGTVVDIKIFRTCELDGMSPTVRKIVDEYEKPIKKLKAELDKQGINTKSLPATYALPPLGKLKRAEDAIYIEVYVQHPDIPGVGDKISYFAANKATLRAVIPEGKEPYTDFRPTEEVSALLSVSSINKRMVTSILLNGALNKLMIELDRTIKDKLGIKYDPNDL